MDIKRIVAKPSEGLIYLERYVNDGSPSGIHCSPTVRRPQLIRTVCMPPSRHCPL